MNPLEGSSLSEAQVCDDLSAFIQLFKRILGLMEAAAATLQRTGDCLPLLERIRTALELIDPLLLRYASANTPLPLPPTTLHRAVCRLLEMIALYRLKYQEGGSAGAGWLLGSLGEAESAIRKWGGEQQLGRMLQVLQLTFIKFCVTCERRQALPDADAPQYSQTYHSMRQKVKGYKQGQTVCKEREVESLSSSEDEPEETVTNKAVARALGEVQRKFELLRGLDLDYSCFKTNFFYAKKDPLQLEKDCLERNTLNARIIATYHDDFYLFQKRRESKANRKNKRRQLMEPQKTRLDSRDIRIRRNRGNTSVSVEERNERERERERQKDSSGKEEGWEDTSKVSYKMNNVYLTLGKKTAPRPRNDTTSPSVIKKKAGLQAMTINQSYYNELDFQTTNSIAFLHQKLKIPTDRHIRLKTEAQQPPTDDNLQPRNLLTEQSTPHANEKIITAGFASILPQRKAKYLEVNCLGNRRESQSRSRIMLSINPNVKKPARNKGDSNGLLAQLRP